MAKRIASTAYQGTRAKKGDARGYIWIRPVGNGVLVAGLVVSTASSRLGLLALAPMGGEDVGGADAGALDSNTLKEEFGSWRRSPSKIAPRKISQLMCVEDCPKKNSEVGEEVHRRSLREKFLN